MRTFVICCACLGIFLAGAVTGGLATARFMRPVTQARAAEHFTRQQFRKVAEQLNLTPEQRERIRPIIFSAARQMQERRREVLSILERMEDEIRTQLDPQQRAKYDEIRGQQRENERRWLREERARRFPMLNGNGPSAPTPTPEPSK